MNLLIVADNDELRRMLSDKLTAEPGITVVGSSATVDRAAELADLLVPDVVLIGAELGERMTGFQAAQAIRQRAPDTGIVLLHAALEPPGEASHAMAEAPASSSWSLELMRSLHTLVRTVKGAADGKIVLYPHQTDQAQTVRQAPHTTSGPGVAFGLLGAGAATR